MALGDPHTVLLWRDGDLQPAGDAPDGPLLVADSWLVDDGRVRGYDRHWARFCGCCADVAIDAAEIARFRVAVTAELPRGGRWFPRVDLVGVTERAQAARLLLRLRPAQPPVRTARVLLAAPGDLRAYPQRKGPDLPLLNGLRAQANAVGADELVLRDAGGRVLEGALHSLLWWDDDGALCSAPDRGTLPSVTRELLLRIARSRDVEVRRRSPLPCELDGCETWLANAAHGIRCVTAWLAGGPAAGPAERAASWRARLDATARHLDA